MDNAKLKRNLGLKSNVFAPTACSLSTQQLIADHMSYHYLRIASAKSTIDSTPPKSIASSQKVRDRMAQANSSKYDQPRSKSVPGPKARGHEYISKANPKAVKVNRQALLGNDFDKANLKAVKVNRQALLGNDFDKVYKNIFKIN
jgi:hypothetical protein